MKLKGEYFMRKSIYSLVTAFTLAIVSVVLCGCSLSVDFGETSENERSAVTIVPETTVETENAATENITETSAAEIETDAEITAEPETEGITEAYVEYHFRNAKYLNEHFDKHGAEFDGLYDYQTAEEYEHGASDVINNPDALYKTEADDGDGIFYLEETNEIVFLAGDDVIRSYFRPSAGKKYFDKQ